MKKTLGSDHPATLDVMNSLALTYGWNDQNEQSLALLEQLVELSIAKQGPEHPDVLVQRHNLAFIYRELRDYERAVEVAQSALSLKALSPHNQENLLTRSGILMTAASSLNQLSRWQEAEEAGREAVSIREKMMPGEWGFFYALGLLGESLLGQDKFDEADTLLVQSHEGLIAHAEKIPVVVRQKRLHEAGERLVRLYLALGQPHEVEKWQKVLQQLEPTTKE
jgi:eukaryotic-like serine/threonine-protein kinase